MRRICSLILLLVLLLVLSCPALAAETDVCSPWAEGYVYDAESVYEIVPPSLRGGDYTQPVTRAEFCEILYEAICCISEYDHKFYGSQTIEMPPLPSGSAFSDTEDLCVSALYGAGIVQGTGEGRFDPDGFLTREMAAAFVARSVSYCGLRVLDGKFSFSDEAAVSSWAKESIDVVCGMGIMNGMGDGTFLPQGVYTREQAVATAIRLIGSYPYLNNREELGDGLVFRFNLMYFWVEDSQGNVVLQLPEYWGTYHYRETSGYDGVAFFSHEGRRVAAAYSYRAGSADCGTTLYDLDTGEILLRLPDNGIFWCLTEDGQYMVLTAEKYTEGALWPTSVYAVYDFDGNQLMPMSEKETLEAAGYRF